MIGAVIIVPLTYISCLLVAFLKCIPFNHQWQINPDPGSMLSSRSVVLFELPVAHTECTARPLHARGVGSTDCLCDGHEHRHGFLLDGDSASHCMAGQSSMEEEGRPPAHVQRRLLGNGLRYPPLRFHSHGTYLFFLFTRMAIFRPYS